MKEVVSLIVPRVVDDSRLLEVVRVCVVYTLAEEGGRGDVHQSQSRKSLQRNVSNDGMDLCRCTADVQPFPLG